MVQSIRDYFSGRQVSASTRKYERRVTRQAMKFAIKEKWITEDPTAGLPKIIVRHKQTEYLDKGEFAAFFDNIGGTNPQRMRALVLLMRWSGLRIGDALMLERSRINHSVLLLHQQKTGTPVSLPLPPVALDALDKLSVDGRRYFMPDGEKCCSI
jgi:integrase/recombinase XerD